MQPVLNNPEALNGASVLIGGIPSPLYYVGPGQINAQIPFELDPAKQYQVVVNANGAPTAPQTIQLSQAAPGLAAFPDGSPIAQHWDDYSLASETSPATPGEYLAMYLVGMGQTDHGVASGAAAPLNPLVRVTSAPVVTLGGNPAPVLFAGLTPESVGLHVRSFCRAIRKDGARRLPPSRRSKSMEGKELAPQSGHVSNSRGLRRGPLEPPELLSEQWHPHESGTSIQIGRPARILFEPPGSEHLGR